MLFLYGKRVNVCMWCTHSTAISRQTTLEKYQRPHSHAVCTVQCAVQSAVSKMLHRKCISLLQLFFLVCCLFLLLLHATEGCCTVPHCQRWQTVLRTQNRRHVCAYLLAFGAKHTSHLSFSPSLSRVSRLPPRISMNHSRTALQHCRLSHNTHRQTRNQRGKELA